MLSQSHSNLYEYYSLSSYHLFHKAFCVKLWNVCVSNRHCLSFTSRKVVETNSWSSYFLFANNLQSLNLGVCVCIGFKCNQSGFLRHKSVLTNMSEISGIESTTSKKRVKRKNRNCAAGQAALVTELTKCNDKFSPSAVICIQFFFLPKLPNLDHGKNFGFYYPFIQ